jgi:uncharacterized protein (TIGR02453 family)
MCEFTGFAEAAFNFYEDLESDNTKAFWDANKDLYKAQVEAPLKALMADLEPEFGKAKIFRPYRDVRFSKDKTPYKSAQGAIIGSEKTGGYYLQVSASGVMVGFGCHLMESAALGAVREAIDDAKLGPQLEGLVANLESAGWTSGGESLKTAPRGYDTDHPRIDLLRRKAFSFGRELGDGTIVQSEALVSTVAGLWREGKPLLAWLAKHGG